MIAPIKTQLSIKIAPLFITKHNTLLISRWQSVKLDIYAYINIGFLNFRERIELVSKKDQELKSKLAPEGEIKEIVKWYARDAKRISKIKIPRIPMPGFLKISIPLPKPIKKIGNYFKNSFQELKQVKWPSRKLSINYTFSVIIFSVLFSLILTGLDWIFSELVKKVLL